MISQPVCGPFAAHCGCDRWRTSGCGAGWTCWALVPQSQRPSVDLRVDLELEETESPSRPAATPPIETVDLRAPAEGLDDESEDEDGAAARR